MVMSTNKKMDYSCPACKADLTWRGIAIKENAFVRAEEVGYDDVIPTCRYCGAELEYATHTWKMYKLRKDQPL